MWGRRKYSPGGYVPFPARMTVLDRPTTAEWARETTVNLSAMADSIQNALTPPRNPKARCHGCHSSEFDAAGRCAYCRQYQWKETA